MRSNNTTDPKEKDPPPLQSVSLQTLTVMDCAGSMLLAVNPIKPVLTVILVCQWSHVQFRCAIARACGNESLQVIWDWFPTQVPLPNILLSHIYRVASASLLTALESS